MVARLHQFRATTAEEEMAWSEAFTQGDGPLSDRCGARCDSGPSRRTSCCCRACSGSSCSTSTRRSRCSSPPCGRGTSTPGYEPDLELGHLPGGRSRSTGRGWPARSCTAGSPRSSRSHSDSRSPTPSRSAAARTRTCCCSWSSRRSSRASCCARSRGRSSSPTTGWSSDRSRRSGCCPRNSGCSQRRPRSSPGSPTTSCRS